MSCQIIWVGFIFVYQKSLKRTFKTSFWVQNHLLSLCNSAVDSQRLLCSEKLVWNVRIKAFWYRKLYKCLNKQAETKQNLCWKKNAIVKIHSFIYLQNLNKNIEYHVYFGISVQCHKRSLDMLIFYLVKCAFPLDSFFSNYEMDILIIKIMGMAFQQTFVWRTDIFTNPKGCGNGPFIPAVIFL